LLRSNNTFFELNRFQTDHRSKVTGDFLAVSKQGILCNFSQVRGRRNSLRFFWRIASLYEFVMVKKIVFQNYISFLQGEIVNLQEYRLSTKKKLLKEDLLKLSVFDANIPRFLFQLDKYIQTADSLYRKIYSVLSSFTGFDDARSKLKSLINNWESEIEKWEPGSVTIWKRIISPLRSIFVGK
jgi:hypothetical protein